MQLLKLMQLIKEVAYRVSILSNTSIRYLRLKVYQLGASPRRLVY